MASTKTPAAKTARKPLVPESKPKAAEPKVADTSKAAADPRDTSQLPEDPPAAPEMQSLASPPTPTRESRDTANDEPGNTAVFPGQSRPRVALLGRQKEETVDVVVPRGFRLTTDSGEHEYAAGFATMPKSHAEHWYAIANGVEIKD